MEENPYDTKTHTLQPRPIPVWSLRILKINFGNGEFDFSIIRSYLKMIYKRLQFILKMLTKNSISMKVLENLTIIKCT